MTSDKEKEYGMTLSMIIFVRPAIARVDAQMQIRVELA